MIYIYIYMYIGAMFSSISVIIVIVYFMVLVFLVGGVQPCCLVPIQRSKGLGVPGIGGWLGGR